MYSLPSFNYKNDPNVKTNESQFVHSLLEFSQNNLPLMEALLKALK